MADKNEWISAKVAKLIEEGKESEEASAIAHSMYEKEHKEENNDEVDRYDEYPDWISPTRMDTTPEGFLLGRAVLTNVGVFTYKNKDGSVRREFRPPEEVFARDSLDSYVGKPVTNNHPTILVDSTNIDKYEKGTIMGPISHDEYHVSAQVLVNRTDTIADVKMGKTALSCGYKVRLDWTPGVWMGVEYDCVQRNIRVNHVAIVEKGRAGDAARLRMDSESTSYFEPTVKEARMPDELRTINLDGVDYKSEDAVINAFKSEKTRADSIQVKLDALSTEKSTVEAERDALKEKMDSLEKELAETKATKLDSVEIDARVNSRLALIAVATKANVEVKNDMDDKALRVAVIKSVSPTANMDGKDDVYIMARYDLAVESLSEKKETEVKQDKADQETRTFNKDTAGATPASKSTDARTRMCASYGKKV